jgi:hypothetical protein
MVKQISLMSVTSDQMEKEVTMSAAAEIRASRTSIPARRGAELRTCPVCADSMFAAETSAFLSDDVVSHLWTCDTCGYGFVTNHTIRKPGGS